MFVCLGLFGVLPVIHGATIYGFRQLDARIGARWVVLQGALYIFGAFLYAVSSNDPVPIPAARPLIGF